jgi:hypothetical protein
VIQARRASRERVTGPCGAPCFCFPPARGWCVERCGNSITAADSLGMTRGMTGRSVSTGIRGTGVHVWRRVSYVQRPCIPVPCEAIKRNPTEGACRGGNLTTSLTPRHRDHLSRQTVDRGARPSPDARWAMVNARHARAASHAVAGGAVGGKRLARQPVTDRQHLFFPERPIVCKWCREMAVGRRRSLSGRLGPAPQYTATSTSGHALRQRRAANLPCDSGR